MLMKQKNKNKESDINEVAISDDVDSEMLDD